MKDHIKLEKLSYCYDIIDIRDIPCESLKKEKLLEHMKQKGEE